MPAGNAVGLQTVALLKRHDRRTRCRSEDPIGVDFELQDSCKIALQLGDLGASIPELERIVRGGRSLPISEFALAVPFADQLFGSLEVHRVLGRESDAPEEPELIEVLEDPHQAFLRTFVASAIEHTVDRQIDRGTPRMVADGARAAADEAAAKHADVAEPGMDFGLFLFDRARICSRVSTAVSGRGL